MSDVGLAGLTPQPDWAAIGLGQTPVSVDATFERKAWWILAGVLFPALAFFVDSGMHVNPLIWESGLGSSRRLVPEFGQGIRQITIYALIGLAMLGLVIFLARPASRQWTALALPLLLLGVLVAGAHAIVFTPLIPLSAMGIVMFGVGLLGFTPFLALAAYSDATTWALKRQARLSQGDLRWAVIPLCATALLIWVAVQALWQQEAGLAVIRQGKDAAAVSAGLRQLGSLAQVSRLELVALYPELEAEGQIRLRNLYFERFGADINRELGRGFR